MISKDNKPILTFRLSDVQMTGAKEYFLSDLNWIDAFPDPDSFFGVLLQNAKSILGLNNSNTNHTSKGSHSNKETITYDNGTYEGSIINGVKSGFGIYTWNERSQWNGDRYEGNWTDDKIDGKGTLYYSNGNKFEGNWKNGVRSGFGTTYYKDGTIEDGYWENDKYIGKNKPKES